MSKTTLQKIRTLAVAGFILGLFYLVYMAIIASIAGTPVLNRPALFGFSTMELQFRLAPWAILVILGFIAVLLTQEDEVTMAFRDFPQPVGGFLEIEAFPIFGESTAMLAAAFYGTFILGLELLTRVHSGFNDAFRGVLIFSDFSSSLFMVAIIVLGGLFSGTICGIAIFIITYRRNSISENSSGSAIGLYFSALIPVAIMAFLFLLLAAIPPGNSTEKTVIATYHDLGSRIPWELALIAGLFLAEFCIVKSAECLFCYVSEKLRIERVNTLAAVLNIVLLIGVIISPLAIFSVAYIATGGLPDTHAGGDLIIGTWQSYQQFDHGNRSDIDREHINTYIFMPDGTYSFTGGNERKKGAWEKSDSYYHLDDGAVFSISYIGPNAGPDNYLFLQFDITTGGLQTDYKQVEKG